MSDSLYDRMNLIRLRNTRGREEPIYILISPDDFASIDTRTPEDKEMEKIDRTAGLYFCGIRIRKSKLANNGEPLAVMGYWHLGDTR
jgi:hypothetical protein